MKQLKNQLQQQEERQKKRDIIFVEVLEKMQEKIDRMEELQKQLLAPVTGRSRVRSARIVLTRGRKRT